MGKFFALLLHSHLSNCVSAENNSYSHSIKLVIKVAAKKVQGTSISVGLAHNQQVLLCSYRWIVAEVLEQNSETVCNMYVKRFEEFGALEGWKMDSRSWVHEKQEK